MEDPKLDNKNIFREWLEKLQQESWQLELLISGFALFGIWESREGINLFIQSSMIDRTGSMSLMLTLTAFFFLLNTAWGIFFINLLIHVVLRGLWIGAIGLRYVSGEINYESLDYHPIFTELLKEKVGYFDDYIERLEKVCSVIFAYTFLLFFMFVSTIMVFLHLIGLGIITSYLGEWDFEFAGAILYGVYLVLGFLVLLDFLTIGSLKTIRSNAFAKIYSYIYRFYSYGTLSFLYRPLLFNFFDYKYTRRLFWFSVPYIILVFFFLPGFNVETKTHYPGNISIRDEGYFSSSEMVKPYQYDDLRQQHTANQNKKKKKKISNISLAQYEITQSQGSFFIKYNQRHNELLEHYYHIQPYNTEGIGHSLFSNTVEDSLIIKSQKEETKIVKELLKAKKAAKGNTKNEKKENPGAVAGFKEGFEQGRYGEREKRLEDPWAIKIDSVRKSFAENRKFINQNKIKLIEESLLNANQIFIDDQNYTDQLSCKFFTHPNLGEKGLLCYFSTDSLADGGHLLRLEKLKYNPRKLDSLETTNINIPFWISSQR